MRKGVGDIHPPHRVVLVEGSPIGRPISKAGWQPPSSTNGADSSAHIGARDFEGMVSNGSVKMQKDRAKGPQTHLSKVG